MTFKVSEIYADRIRKTARDCDITTSQALELYLEEAGDCEFEVEKVEEVDDTDDDDFDEDEDKPDNYDAA